MALPPKLRGHRYTFIDSSASSDTHGELLALHTLEFYLDYVCPFSASTSTYFFTSLTSPAPPKLS